MPFPYRAQLFLCAAVLLSSCASRPLADADRERAFYGEDHLPGRPLDNESCIASGAHFAIATSGDVATRAGRDVAKNDGNVVDVAVASAFVLAVEKPYAAGLGGGGFLVVHKADETKTAPSTSFDFRETAPAQPIPHAPTVGVPGFVTGLWKAHQQYGRRPWKELLEPAVALAERGFPVSRAFATILAAHWESLRRQPYLATLFGRPGGLEPLRTGDWFRQNDLGATLRQIADRGPAALGHGLVATKFHDTVPGILPATYPVLATVPESVPFHGRQVLVPPPPSAAGLLFGEVLRALGPVSLGEESRYPERYVHLLSVALQHAFADLATGLGDPAFGAPALATYFDDRRVTVVRRALRAERAMRAQDIAPLTPVAAGGGTAQVSVLDAEGSAASLSISLGSPFGAYLAVPGTGILLNDALAAFGGAPTGANLAVPGKRPASMLVPTVVVENGRAVLAVGGSGGPRAATAVLQVLLNYLEIYGGSLSRAVFAPRLHHEWFPDQLDLENGLLERYGAQLAARGHEVHSRVATATVEAVSRERRGTLTATTDPREPGGVEAW